MCTGLNAEMYVQFLPAVSLVVHAALTLLPGHCLKHFQIDSKLGMAGNLFTMLFVSAVFQLVRGFCAPIKSIFCFKPVHQKFHYVKLNRPRTHILLRGREPELEDHSQPLTDAVKKSMIDRAREIKNSDRMPLILNLDHGGYGISKYAINLYKELYKEMNGVEYKDPDHDSWDSELQFRCDPLMAKIVEEYPIQAGESLGVHYLNKKYKGYIHITTYDGAETARILKNKFRLDKIRALDNSSTLSNKEKVNQLHEILTERIEPFYIASGVPQPAYLV